MPARSLRLQDVGNLILSLVDMQWRRVAKWAAVFQDRYAVSSGGVRYVDRYPTVQEPEVLFIGGQQSPATVMPQLATRTICHSLCR
jgi:hypothetical protein